MGGGPEGGLEKIQSHFEENTPRMKAEKVGQVYVAATLSSYSTTLRGIGEGELERLFNGTAEEVWHCAEWARYHQADHARKRLSERCGRVGALFLPISLQHYRRSIKAVCNREHPVLHALAAQSLRPRSSSFQSYANAAGQLLPRSGVVGANQGDREDAVAASKCLSMHARTWRTKSDRNRGGKNTRGNPLSKRLGQGRYSPARALVSGLRTLE